MYPSLQHTEQNRSEGMEKISHHVHSWCHGNRPRRPNATERVPRTKVKLKSGVQPKHSSGLYNVSHGFKGAGRLRYLDPFCGSDRVLELTSDLLSS